MRPLDWIRAQLVGFLTQPVGHYELRARNSPELLRRHIRKGDVLLVDGDQRVSTVIKVLTQSCWSHAALYIGDELLTRGDELRERTLERHGDAAHNLLVEALPDGVVASPLDKYVDFNIRVCRPHRPRPEDLKQILDQAVGTIGWRYDLRNLLDLADHLIKLALMPHRHPRRAQGFGSDARSEVICSSLLGRLFHGVGFPVLPSVTFPDGESPPPPRRLRGLLRRNRSRYAGLFHKRHPTLLTPRDFDLSPYFEVIKFNAIAGRSFDYQRIAWAEETQPDE